MAPRMVHLLLELPFERVMEIAAQNGITVHYDANLGSYHCEYWEGSSQVTVASQKKITLAVANAIIGQIKAGI